MDGGVGSARPAHISIGRRGKGKACRLRPLSPATGPEPPEREKAGLPRQARLLLFAQKVKVSGSAEKLEMVAVALRK